MENRKRIGYREYVTHLGTAQKYSQHIQASNTGHGQNKLSTFQDAIFLGKQCNFHLATSARYWPT